MKVRAVSLVVLILISAASGLTQTRSPIETVKEFYRFSNARSPIFNRRHIESRKRWYTPELYRVFLEELREQTDYLKRNPTDKGYFGDGLSFRPLDEPCYADGKRYERSQTISRTEIGTRRAYVDVKFAYPEACTEEAIYYRVNLKRVRGKWLIDDWTYPDGSTLTRDMGEN